MSPAEELRTAAQTLMDLADETAEEIESNPYWHSELTARPRWFANGVDNALGGPAAQLAGLLSPEAARALAAWLRAEAAIWDAVETVKAEYGPKGLKVTTPLSTHDQALAVARAINGEQQ